MSDLNNFFNNPNDNNNNNNNNTTDDFYDPSPNQEPEIEDNRNLVDSPDTDYNRRINDNSNMINLNHLPDAKFEREYNFDEGEDKKTIIKNIILILLVVIIGFFLVYNFSGVKKDSTPSEETPTPEVTNTPEASTPPQESTPVENEENTNHSDEEIYLEVSTSKTIKGSGIEQVGKEKFYQPDINKEINSNGVSFIIKSFTDKDVTLILNTELIDTSSTLGCRKNLCSVGSEVTLDGKITVILETTDKENKINYSFNLYNIKY